MSHVIQSFKSLLQTLVLFSEVKKKYVRGDPLETFFTILTFFLEYLGIIGADKLCALFLRVILILFWYNLLEVACRKLVREEAAAWRGGR